MSVEKSIVRPGAQRVWIVDKKHCRSGNTRMIRDDKRRGFCRSFFDESNFFREFASHGNKKIVECHKYSMIFFVKKIMIIDIGKRSD